MVTCQRCGRTSIETYDTKYSTKVIPYPGATYVTWCCDCLLKSPCYSNER
jgi:hypothetical protein